MNTNWGAQVELSNPSMHVRKMMAIVGACAINALGNAPTYEFESGVAVVLQALRMVYSTH